MRAWPGMAVGGSSANVSSSLIRLPRNVGDLVNGSGGNMGDSSEVDPIPTTHRNLRRSSRSDILRAQISES